MDSIFANKAANAAAGAEEYRRAMLAVIEKRDPLEILEELPHALDELTRGIPRDVLRRPEAEGKWSVTQVMQHLADTELVWGNRYRMVMAEDHPAIVGYDQDLWATNLHYEEVELEDALKQLLTLREANLRLLRRASPETLARIGEHSERGPESLDLMTRMVAAHDIVHRRQMARVLAAVGEKQEPAG